MKKCMLLLPVLALTCLLATSTGCGGKDEKKDEKKESSDKGETNVVAELACTACGDDVADGHQCDADAEKCTKCGLGKGTALCCKATAEELASLNGKPLCLACGHAAEEGHKCDTTHQVCEQCKVHTDSILCKCDAKEAKSGS